MKPKVHRVISDGETMLAALIIACAFTELTWWWFWVCYFVCMLQISWWHRENV